MDKPIPPTPRYEKNINASSGLKYFLLSMFFLPLVLVLLKTFVG